MSTLTFRQLVCEDLNYCCPYAFFCLYRKTGTITERLGLHVRTVQLHKAKWKQGEHRCENAANCLSKKIRLRTPPRYKPR